MQKDEEEKARIHRLVVEDILETISPKDRDWLYAQMDSDTEIAGFYQQVKESLAQPGVMAQIDQKSGPSALNTILARPTRRNIRTLTTKVVVMAGAAAAIIAAVVLLRPGPSASKVKVLVLTKGAVDPAGVILTIEGSPAQDLSATTGTVTIGSNQFSNNNKTVQISSVSDKSAIATLEVPVGKDYKIILPDSTIVWMNSATRLSFPLAFSHSSREITLSGEAYLKVTKDPRRPFSVRLPGTTVKVLGTEFNVNTYHQNATAVALVEGSVELQASSKVARLSPGKMATVNNENISITGFKADRVLSWREGLYYFSDAPLEDVFEVIPRWFGVKVKFDNDRWQRHHFSGVIDRNLPVSSSLDALKDLGMLDYYFDKDSVVHIK
jgi:transmembrane sensor